jgi:hypothetical protein
MKKNTKDIIVPYFVKNSKNKTTHVCLSIESYDALMKEVAEYKKLKKEKKIRWLNISK